MKLAVVGTGYVGLVSGVCLAKKGHSVVCVDIDSDKVREINSKVSPIHEEGLPELLRDVIDQKRFRADTDLNAALEFCDAVIIAVGTPTVNGKIDLKYLREVSRQIGTYLKHSPKFLSIIVKSTVLPSTTDTFVRREVEVASGKKFGQFGLGMNPEFLREGKAVLDFMRPDRIVLGYEDAKTLSVLEKIYDYWDVDKLRVNTRTAEMIKYANNCLLALQISAVNELANLAAKAGKIDILDVIRGVSMDKRWNPILKNGDRVNPEILSYLIPGPGFGGSCFPKDVQALYAYGKDNGQDMPILRGVLDVNSTQYEQVASMLSSHFGGSIKGKRVLLLGLAFKPGTDDVRESASINIAKDLLRRGVRLMVHDPIAINNFINSSNIDFSDIECPKDWETMIEDAQIIIITTNWEEYKRLSNHNLKGKVVFDTRRFIPSDSLAGAHYLSIGRMENSMNGMTAVKSR